MSPRRTRKGSLGGMCFQNSTSHIKFKNIKIFIYEPPETEQIYIPDQNSVYRKALTVLVLIVIVIISGHKCKRQKSFPERSDNNKMALNYQCSV